jgi:hypothetical protein
MVIGLFFISPLLAVWYASICYHENKLLEYKSLIHFKITVMKSKILIYDDNCPLCTWYSSLFVAWGLLPPEGRKPFSSVEPSLLLSIDLDKSRNEIPLLDTKSGKVLYGIDALLDILGQRTGFYHNGGKK